MKIVGCGCGTTTLAAARLIAPGQAVGLDLSGPMLARARAAAAAAGLGNAAPTRSAAQDSHPKFVQVLVHYWYG